MFDESIPCDSGAILRDLPGSAPFGGLPADLPMIHCYTGDSAGAYILAFPCGAAKSEQWLFWPADDAATDVNRILKLG